jgi:AbrB family looped-hinge helix DNA binding protein
MAFKLPETGQSVVSVRGQTVIPKEIRTALGIEPGTKLFWFLDDDVIKVRVMAADPVRALRGILKGKGSTAELLAERRADRDREEAQLEERLARWRSSS